MIMGNWEAIRCLVCDRLLWIALRIAPPGEGKILLTKCLIHYFSSEVKRMEEFENERT